MTIHELTKKWESIPLGNEGYLLIDEDYPLSFNIGYYEDNKRCMIVLDSGEVKEIFPSQSILSRNINLPGNKIGLQFILQDAVLDELFITLCWDLMTCTANCSRSIAIKALIDRFKKWQKLLQRATPEILSATQQKGLMGELLFLSYSIDKVGGIKAINAWVGPDGSDQDFIFEDHWVEVKSVSLDANGVKISSLQQLDRLDNGFLKLYFIDKTAANGKNSVTLSSLIHLVNDKIETEWLRDLFAIKLFKYGCACSEWDKYNDNYYRLSEEHLYSIEDTFPRLTRKNVPTEIIAAQYEISLATIEKFRKV